MLLGSIKVLRSTNPQQYISKFTLACEKRQFQHAFHTFASPLLKNMPDDPEIDPELIAEPVVKPRRRSSRATMINAE